MPGRWRSYWSCARSLGTLRVTVAAKAHDSTAVPAFRPAAVRGIDALYFSFLFSSCFVFPLVTVEKDVNKRGGAAAKDMRIRTKHEELLALTAGKKKGPEESGRKRRGMSSFVPVFFIYSRFGRALQLFLQHLFLLVITFPFHLLNPNSMSRHKMIANLRFYFLSLPKRHFHHLFILPLSLPLLLSLPLHLLHLPPPCPQGVSLHQQLNHQQRYSLYYHYYPIIRFYGCVSGKIFQKQKDHL